MVVDDAVADADTDDVPVTDSVCVAVAVDVAESETDPVPVKEAVTVSVVDEVTVNVAVSDDVADSEGV